MDSSEGKIIQKNYKRARKIFKCNGIYYETIDLSDQSFYEFVSKVSKDELGQHDGVMFLDCYSLLPQFINALYSRNDLDSKELDLKFGYFGDEIKPLQNLSMQNKNLTNSFLNSIYSICHISYQEFPLFEIDIVFTNNSVKQILAF